MTAPDALPEGIEKAIMLLERASWRVGNAREMANDADRHLELDAESALRAAILAALRERERGRDEAVAVLAKVDGHWCEYADGEFGGEDPEGVAMLARAHSIASGKPTCVCGHEQGDHERPADDPSSEPCELCGCLDFKDARAPTPSPSEEPKP